MPLKMAAAMTGYAVSTSVIGSILTACESEPVLGWEPSFFSIEQAQLVEEMAATMLPATEKGPGAREVGVHKIMDLLVGDCFRPKNRERFMQGLEAFKADATEKLGKSFVEATPEESLAFLRQVDDAAKLEKKEIDKTPKPKLDDPLLEVSREPFFLDFKKLAIACYFSSKEVGKEVLAYDPIPGNYDGCVSLEETTQGRAWTI